MATTKVDVNLIGATGTPGSGNFLRGDGTWNAPAAAGWEFVESVTASTSSTIDLGEGNLAAGYNYQIDCIQVDNSADLTQPQSPILQFGTGGTPTYQTASYVSQNGSFEGGNYGYGGRSPTTSGIMISNSDLGELGGATAGETWDAIVHITNPAAATEHRVISQSCGHNTSGLETLYFAGGHREASETVTGLRLLNGTGTFISGIFVLSRRKIA